MSAAEIIALIRDLFLIGASVVAIVIFLGVGFVLLRLYPAVKRTIQNVEHSTGVIRDVVSQPLSLLGPLVGLFNRGLKLLGTFRKRDRRNENGES
jgi:hypothetical protein